MKTFLLCPPSTRRIGTALVLLLGFATLSGAAAAVPSAPPVAVPAGAPAREWGLALMARTSAIPYVAGRRTNTTLIPLFFYEGDRLFLRGLESGVHLHASAGNEINAVMRTRFLDIPQEFQNAVQGDTRFYGLQARRQAGETWWLQAEFMADDHGRWQANGRIGTSLAWPGLVFVPSLSLHHLSRDYNDHYYGLSSLVGATRGRAGSAWEIAPRLEARYPVFSDLHLVGAVGYTWFSDGIRDLPTIARRGTAELSLGFGFFQPPGRARHLGAPLPAEPMNRTLDASPYLRVAQGWGTPSNLGGILTGQVERDPFRSRLTSVFFGHPLTDRLFTLPIAVHLTPGLVWHHASAAQSDAVETVVAIKAYYTLTWPVRWRVGFGEGVSWISRVTELERSDLAEKGYRPSQLMNFLDFSVDLNAGDLLRHGGLDAWWLGGGIHHRSSIFETSSQFGRIKGGSNFLTVYLQRDL
jgi:outer membrane protein